MYIYEYTCNNCFVDFEITLPHMKAGTDVIICPCCKSKEVIRRFKPLGVHYHAKDFVSHPINHTEI
jgi:putative FmdB family regulatory protein